MEEDLDRNGMFVRNLNMQKYERLSAPMEAITKVRYKTPGAMSMLSQEDDDLIRVEFGSMVSAITPGQSAVFYEDDEVIGGGHILSNFMV